MTHRRFCFVVPRYFEGIAGGAETLMGGLARALDARGDTVEIVTTCARDNRSWQNELPAGEARVDGIKVTRFPVDERNLDVWIPIQVAISEGKLTTAADQLAWMTESVSSQALYSYLVQNSGRFDLSFFGPYLFGTTFWGSMLNPSKSVLIPCLHDESYAYLEVIASMFRQVRGCLFNAAPEMHLTRSLYGEIPGDVVGMGFEPLSCAAVEGLEPFFADGSPYILYLGRKETGKNVQVLVDYFCAAKDEQSIPPEVQLVILGGGSFSDLHRDGALARGDIIDLPHATEREKQRLLRHALYLCQPSTNESFSIVIMEAWMVGTPVVVHGQCAVTRQHVVESGGGLYFTSSADLGAVTAFYLERPEARRAQAEAGRRYVETEYSWSAVIDRFDSAVSKLLGAKLEVVPTP